MYPEISVTPTAAEIDSVTTQPLTREYHDEVLAFLATRTIQAVIMAGFIRDNSLESPLNRGSFYACRDSAGRIVGVALIGHTTLVEAHSEAALQSFACLAQKNPAAHMILGEQEQIQRFWHYYERGGQSPRLFCGELLLEQRLPIEVRELVSDLRLATLDELEQVAAAHAHMAYEESGVNPMELDPAGFRLRCALRILRKRVWVWVKNGVVIFKADIIAQTPEITYLEGVFVNPEERGKGYGSRCLSQLGQNLLTASNSICVLVSEKSQGTAPFYHRAGYKLRARYDTIFLQHHNQRG